MDEIAVIDVIVPPPALIEVLAGTKGDPGDPGPPGPPGGSSSVFFYKIDAQGTNQSDPGSGKLRYNAANQLAATTLYVDWLTTDGFDAHLFFELVNVPRQIVIQDKDLSVNYQVWDLTGPAINHPDWFEVPVAFVSSNGNATFSNNHNVAVLLVAEGGGAALPTAPLGQVLTSQGDGTPPIFQSVVALISQLANQGWQLYVEPGGDFVIRHVDATGAFAPQRVGIDPYNGGFYTVFGGFGALNGGVQVKWITPDAHSLADHMSSGSRNTIGNLATISDSTTNTPGAVIAGGGTFNVLARWNGTNWMVISG